MHMQSFHSTLRRAARNIASTLVPGKAKNLQAIESRVMNPQAYVTHLEMPMGLTVVGYESPNHGDLIPVDGGFDFYPGKEFRKLGQETLTIHLSDGKTSWPQQIELSSG